jgi:hypothetical protein
MRNHGVFKKLRQKLRHKSLGAGVFNVQNLIHLAAHFGIPGPTDCDCAGCISVSRKPEAATGGSGWGLTRRFTGSGWHRLITDGVEHPSSVRAKALTARQ